MLPYLSTGFVLRELVEIASRAFVNPPMSASPVSLNTFDMKLVDQCDFIEASDTIKTKISAAALLQKAEKLSYQRVRDACLAHDKTFLRNLDAATSMAFENNKLTFKVAWQGLHAVRCDRLLARRGWEVVKSSQSWATIRPANTGTTRKRKLGKEEADDDEDDDEEDLVMGTPQDPVVDEHPSDEDYIPSPASDKEVQPVPTKRRKFKATE